MRRGDVLWTRRRLLGTGAAALAVGCVTPAAPCDAGALTRRVSTIATTDRDQLLPIVARWLAEGVPTDEIAHAAFVAGLDASSLTTHSNHPVKAVEAARVVASELEGSDAAVALMWAVDGVSPTPNGIRNPRDTGRPMPELDESALPDGDVAFDRLIETLGAFDRTGAQEAVVALYRAHGPEPVVDVLTEWGARNVLPNGHYAIGAAQYLRLLERNDWLCAEVALRHIIYPLASDPTMVDGSAAAWRGGEEAFQANRARRAEVVPTWEEGAASVDGARDLLAGLRGVTEEEASQLTVEALAGGLAPASIWDAVFLRSVEALVYGGDEHAVTATNALYDLYLRAARPEARLLILLQAPAWAARMVDPAGAIDSLEPSVAPDDPGAIALEGSPQAAVRMGLAWLAEGGSVEALVTAAHRHVVRNHAEWHGYKVPVAALELARAASAPFAPVLSAVHAIAWSRGEPPWSRLDEALAEAEAAGLG